MAKAGPAKKTTAWPYKLDLSSTYPTLLGKTMGTPFESADSYRPGLSAPTLLDISPLGFQAQQKPACRRQEGEKGKPQIDTVFMNSDLFTRKLF